MKKLFATLLGAALVLVLTAMPNAKAAANPAITDYNVSVHISETNTYDVTEVITANFETQGHGITRDIPTQGTWVRDKADGGDTKYAAKLSNIQVADYKYTVSSSGGVTTLKIGDANTYVEGPQTYTISYRLQFYDDGLPKADEVYYNIIGTEWRTTIDHVSFSVTLPKKFDSEQLGFSTGASGTQGYNTAALTYRVSGNTITGEVTQQMAPYEGLTMRLTLPQGYFSIPFQGGADLVLLVFIAALAVLGLILFLRFGRDQQPVKTVEFYAPDNMTPAEVGYIIDGAVDNKDVISLIIYWAHKGYLTIEDQGSSSFSLHRLRDIEQTASDYEKHMFFSLFGDGPTASSASLKNKFYKTMESTKTMLSKSFNSDARRVFTKTSMALRPLLSFMTALPVMVTLFLANYRSSYEIMQSLFFSVIAGLFIMLPVAIIISTLRRWRAKKPVGRVVTLVISFLLCFIAMVVFYVLSIDSIYIKVLPLCAVVGTILLGISAAFIEKRTNKGIEWLGKILGFKEFLELAERDKLVALVDQDPKYFYNILPFAWVLNVSDKWSKKFETIAIQPPDWYYGHNDMFYPVLFMSQLNHSMNSIQGSMTSSPSSSSGRGIGGGSGFSGGGFSGGGGGGGGGGGW